MLPTIDGDGADGRATIDAQPRFSPVNHGTNEQVVLLRSDQRQRFELRRGGPGLCRLGRGGIEDARQKDEKGNQTPGRAALKKTSAHLAAGGYHGSLRAKVRADAFINVRFGVAALPPAMIYSP